MRSRRSRRMGRRRKNRSALRRSEWSEG